MSQAHALSDDEVAGELRKMTAFIRQEALEKAKEIEIKADEEFAIEKSKLVRQETANIDKQYEKKFKQASMTQQITRSTLTNKSRLKLLSARQEVLDDLFEQVRGKLGEVTKDHDRYQQVSTKLILEGVYALNEEKELHARAREVDFDIVRKALQGARKEYKGVVHRDLSIDLDEENPLPPSCVGGVFIVGGKGKIDVNDTFEERLKLLQIDGLPAVRTMLFGSNANRKFYD